MAKALVLGGSTGLLGMALMNELQAKGWETCALGREDGDILDFAFLEKKLERIAPDAIFNTIAWTQVDDAEDHPQEADRINRLFPDQLSHMLGRSNIWLAHYGTDFIFSGPAKEPWTEEDEPRPESVYGRTKYAGEQAVLKNMPDSACVIRTAWLFGPGKKNFVDTIIKACKKNDTIKVVDDQFGSPTFTKDLAGWSVALAEKKAAGIWHGANSGIASWCELANEAADLMGLSCRVCPITTDQWPQKAKRPYYSPLSNNKLSDFLGKKPRPWPQALRDYLFHDYEMASKEKEVRN